MAIKYVARLCALLSIFVLASTVHAQEPTQQMKEIFLKPQKIEEPIIIPPAMQKTDEKKGTCGKLCNFSRGLVTTGILSDDLVSARLIHQGKMREANKWFRDDDGFSHAKSLSANFAAVFGLEFIRSKCKGKVCRRFVDFSEIALGAAHHFFAVWNFAKYH